VTKQNSIVIQVLRNENDIKMMIKMFKATLIARDNVPRLE